MNYYGSWNNRQKVLLKCQNLCYNYNISELKIDDSQTYEVAVKQHYENFNGYSPFSISINIIKKAIFGI